MILRITKHGEPVLKGRAEPADYELLRKDLPALLRDMWATMYAARGVGLAAPQVGLPLRLAVIDVKTAEGKPDRLVLINPEVVAREGAVVEEEGCLSVPGVYARVRRHSRVRVRAFDEKGRVWERTGTGLLARAFEHEVDHLDGKLFLDRLDLVQRLKVAGLLRDLKKNWK
ncbi:MAG: peptide deformylase [Elusimicrobiota bacterium]|jgi:peptide deformylase